MRLFRKKGEGDDLDGALSTPPHEEESGQAHHPDELISDEMMGHLIQGAAASPIEADHEGIVVPSGDASPVPEDPTTAKRGRLPLFSRFRKGAETPAEVPELAEGAEAQLPPASDEGEGAPVASVFRRRGRRERPAGQSGYGHPPIQVIIGWLEETSRRDVIEHAKGFARDHIETLETAWVTTAEFRGGTLFEIHEGGAGAAYLPGLVEAISADPDQVLWVPSGTRLNRVVTFSLVDGRPNSMMLTEEDSARIRNSGQVPVERSGKMRRLLPRGTPVLVTGLTLFAASFCGLLVSAAITIQTDRQPIPSLTYDPNALPHGQIVSLSDALREDRWVSKIEYVNGQWRAEFETFEAPNLPEDTEGAQRMIDQTVEREELLLRELERSLQEGGRP